MKTCLPARCLSRTRDGDRATVGFARGDRLPAHGLALLVQLDEAMLGIEVLRRQRQGSSASAGGLGMQPEKESVEGRVIPRGRGNPEELLELAVRQGPAGAAEPARLRHTFARLVREARGA